MGQEQSWYNKLPEVRHTKRYRYGSDVFYEDLDQTETRLFVVAGFSRVPENLLDHDAFIKNGKILESRHNERFQTVDGYHKDLDRQVSLNIVRDLDEPLVVLDKVPTLGDD